MSAFWHPLSAVYLEEPPMRASPVALRMLLAGEGRARIRYGGDRMWPALRHGQSIQVVPFAEREPARGDVVLALDRGVPDLVRVESAGPELVVGADAEDAAPRPVDSRDLLGRLPGVPARGGRRGWHRTWLDVREAWVGRPDSEDDPATTVRDKYDEQAAFYARNDAPPLEPELSRRIADTVRPGGRVLVAGSGTGREAFALEAMGFDVVGVDFAPRMVAIATQTVKERGSRVRFVAGDLRVHEEPAGSLDAAVFTYDVYSFLPTREARREALARLSRGLAPRGALFLSARRSSTAGQRAILALQWAAARLRGRRAAWGDSHTRWLDGDGRLRRSFVHVFMPRALDAELMRAGFSAEDWAGGHGLYRNAP